MVLFYKEIKKGNRIMNKENKNSKSKIAANNRYVENTYDRFTFRVKRNESPTKSEIKNSAKNENMSVNSFIIAAVLDRINGCASLDIKDLSAYARSAGMTEEEYIKAAVTEKMKRQDQEYTEDVTREKINEYS